MKKLFTFILGVCLLSSCINSKYTATDITKMVDDDALVGTWSYVAPESKELPAGIDRITVSKTSQKGVYDLQIILENDQKDDNPSPRIYISDLGKGIKLINFGGKDKEGNEEFFYFKYAIKGDKIYLKIMMEKEMTDATKKGKEYDRSKSKPVVFADETKLRAFIKKNIRKPEYWGNDMIFNRVK